MKHRMRQSAASTTQLARDAFLIVFGLFIMVVLYVATERTLRFMIANVADAYLPPSLALGLFLMFIFGVLILTNTAAAYGALFQSQDTELLLGTPVSPWRFYAGKVAEVMLGSSWMPIVFGVPAVVAFGVVYGGGLLYWAVTIAAMLPFFAFATSCGVLLALAFAVIVPPQRSREIVWIVAAFIVLGIGYFVKLLFDNTHELHDLNNILKLLSLMTVPNTRWMPSYWAGQAMGEALVPSGRSVLPYIGLLCSACLLTLSTGYLIIRTRYAWMYSRVKSHKSVRRWNSRGMRDMLLWFGGAIPQSYRALAVKEWKLFFRDVTQLVQLVLLVGICIAYLYHFKILQTVEQATGIAGRWWHNVLVVSNAALGGFVVTAASTRFVFPSISLEGSAFWLLQTSPMSLRAYLIAKFWCWYPALATASVLVLGIGALSIGASPFALVSSTVLGIVMSAGLVGMAIGLGGMFANFTWEHPSQLAASFGSLVYMLASTALILACMGPGIILLLLNDMRWLRHLPDFERYTLYFSSLYLVTYINFAVARWALNAGGASLELRER